MKKLIIKNGDRYNRLTIIEELDGNTKGVRYFLCKCDCGNSTKVTLGDLRQGHTKSCGCYNREIAKKTFEKINLRHGHARQSSASRTYISWYAMKKRCNDKSFRHYGYYGGRGIIYNPRWDKFENFLEDMGERPDGMSLDRINVNGNYCKENCRWATMRQQNNNKQKTYKFLYDGKKYTLPELAEKVCIPYNILRERLYRTKWGLQRSIKTPIKVKSKNILYEYDGISAPLSFLVNKFGNVSDNVARSRIRRGWSIEKSLLTPSAKYARKSSMAHKTQLHASHQQV